MSTQQPLLAWIDTETTGLGQDDHLIEIALVFTDAELNEVGQRYTTVLQPAPSTFARIHANDFVREMHAVNGLTAELETIGDDAPTVTNVDARIRELIDVVAEDGQDVHIAGGGVAAFDLPLVRRLLPLTAERLHYRPIDVSLVAGAYRMASGGRTLYRKAQNKAHRALDDVLEDLEVARAAWVMFRSHDADVSVADALRIGAPERILKAATLTHATIHGDTNASRDVTANTNPADLLGGSVTISAYLARELAELRGTSIASVLDEVRARMVVAP